MKLGRAGEGYFDINAYMVIFFMELIPIFRIKKKEILSSLLMMLSQKMTVISSFKNKLIDASMSEDDQSLYQVDKEKLEFLQELLNDGQKYESKLSWFWGGLPERNQKKPQEQKQEQKFNETPPNANSSSKVGEKNKIKQKNNLEHHYYRTISEEMQDQPPILQQKLNQPILQNDANQQNQGIFNSFIGILKGKKESKEDYEIRKGKELKDLKELKEIRIDTNPTALSPPQILSPASNYLSTPKKDLPSQIPIMIQESLLEMKDDQDSPVQQELVEMSICGNAIQQNVSAQQKQQIFEQNKVSYETFAKDPLKIIGNKDIVFRIGDYSYSRDAGVALLLSRVVFNKDISIEQMVLDKKVVKQSLWNRWFGSKNNTNPNKQKEEQQKASPRANPVNMVKYRKLSEDMLISDTASVSSTSRRRVKQYISKTYCNRKSLKPNSEMLQKLNLKYGMNKITYKVHTDLQGSRELSGHIFLVKSNSKIVISDVDGTITKQIISIIIISIRSDVFGQLMPIMGTDWTHPGVAQLYQNIAIQGYQIIYLTARGIGQSNQTKNFIYSMQQGNIQLPPGPVIMSPDRLLPSFKREVIDKTPEVFKIQALKDIKNILSSDSLYAGLGNRETDALAYQTVGIDENRIFIIDTESNVHIYNQAQHTSYIAIDKELNLYFPPVDDQEYQQQNFWKISPDQLDILVKDFDFF